MALCEKCIGATCYGAPCNMDCRHYGKWCETWVMGGGDLPFDGNLYMTKRDAYDFAEFLCQRVMTCNRRMHKAGVEVGDTVVRVNGQFADTVEEFAKLVLALPAGTELDLIKTDGSRKTVTL